MTISLEQTTASVDDRPDFFDPGTYATLTVAFVAWRKARALRWRRMPRIRRWISQLFHGQSPIDLHTWYIPGAYKAAGIAVSANCSACEQRTPIIKSFKNCPANTHSSGGSAELVEFRSRTR